MGDQKESLVPEHHGVENYIYKDHAVTVFEGSAFNPDNPQHFKGSDAVRYGIAIQEARTAGDYATADARAAIVRNLGYRVGTGKGKTIISNPLLSEMDGIIMDLPKDHPVHDWPAEGENVHSGRYYRLTTQAVETQPASTA